MRNFLLSIGILGAMFMNAQTYSFTKSTGTYANLTGATILNNTNWVDFETVIKLPFAFKYWGVALSDSIYVDDWGSLSVDNSFGEEISFMFEDLNSRGASKSPISYVISGVTPNRILKVEFQNIGFDGDLPGLADSANAQCWLYETTNVIEYRYGTASVKTTTWTDAGVYVGIFDPSFLKFVNLEGNPASPLVNTSNMNAFNPLTTLPAAGTIYKFTPSGTGINSPKIKLQQIGNTIIIPTTMIVNSVKVFNVNGQLMMDVKSIDSNIDILTLPPGVYFISLQTNEGTVTEKVIRY